LQFSTGWGAAAEIARRALVKYMSPKKRGESSADILTIDQVCWRTV